MSDTVKVPSHCVAALLFANGSVDLPGINRTRLTNALQANFDEDTFWVRKDDLEMLLGCVSNGGVHLGSMTASGRIQCSETKNMLPDGRIEIIHDYEAIFFTYAYETIRKTIAS